MDTLQYVYSTSESSDDDDVVVQSHKDVLSQNSSSSTKLIELVGGYNRGRRKSPPTDRRGLSDKKPGSPEPGRGRSQESRSRSSPESRSRTSPDSRSRTSVDSRKDRKSSDRHSPSRRSEGHRSRRRHDKDHRDKDRRHSDRSKNRRRDRSREHRHDRRSRSPRRSHRDSPKRKSKDRSRTRSPPHRKPFDPKNKLYILTKMGIDYKGTESVDNPNRAGGAAGSSGPSVPQYYNPLTINAGKYAEQIAKRKLLWNNKKAEKEEAAKTGSSVWQGAKFSQDSDGKLTAKFQRLMGMKNPGGDNANSSGQEIIKKQEELFSSMEMQYEVARATTHTQRGVGLGFGPRHIP